MGATQPKAAEAPSPAVVQAVVRRIAGAARGQETEAAATCKQYMESYRRLGEEHRDAGPLGRLNFYALLTLCLRSIKEAKRIPMPIPYTGRDDCRRHVQHLVVDFVQKRVAPELKAGTGARDPLLEALIEWTKEETRWALEERARQRDAPWTEFRNA